MSFFYFYKIRKQEGKTGPACGVGTSEQGEKVGKESGGEYSANTVYTYMSMEKNDNYCSYFKNGEGVNSSVSSPSIEKNCKH
jgi:hypothetical protein